MTTTWMRFPALAVIISTALFVPTTVGAAKMPAIAWSPSGSFSYGTLDAADGQTGSQTFTLSNADGGTTGTLTVSLSGASAFSLSADTCTGGKLSPKKTCGVMVRYAPTRNESDSATLTGTSTIGASASVSLTGASAWHAGDLTTWSQGSWDDTPTTSNVAGLLNDNYDSVYSSTGGVFETGIDGAGGFSDIFTTAVHLLDYLPTGGSVAALSSDSINATSDSSGIFGGDVAALKLNVDFSDAGLLTGNSHLKFGDLTLCNFSTLTDLNGISVRDFLSIVNAALGGGTTTDSIADLDPVTADLNVAFGGGGLASDGFTQAHLQPGSCP